MNSGPTDILPLAFLSGNRQPGFQRWSLRRRGNDQPISLIHTHETWYLGAADGPDALSSRGQGSHRQNRGVDIPRNVCATPVPPECLRAPQE
jgi:hypothetical protein